MGVGVFCGAGVYSDAFGGAHARQYTVGVFGRGVCCNTTTWSCARPLVAHCGLLHERSVSSCACLCACGCSAIVSGGVCVCDGVQTENGYTTGVLL